MKIILTIKYKLFFKCVVVFVVPGARYDPILARPTRYKAHKESRVQQ